MSDIEVFDPVLQLKGATTRAKSDVANKIVSMFLHVLSRKLCALWGLRTDERRYLEHVTAAFAGRCPYCRITLGRSNVIVEHPDGMNRYRAGLHVPGNVIVACKSCNSEKRRDDSLETLQLAATGWESFLSHDSARCHSTCRTCAYWQRVWPDPVERTKELNESLGRIRQFRASYAELQRVLPYTQQHLPSHLLGLYKDCQAFADAKIGAALNQFTMLVNQSGEPGSQAAND